MGLGVPGMGMAAPVPVAALQTPLPPPFQGERPPIPAGEPPSKKQKVEGTAAISEAEWIATHPEPIILKVASPLHENKNGWKLDGQTIEIPILVSEKISALKEAICTAVNGLPGNKQNLKVEGLPYFKDKDSLAIYNLVTGTDIVMGVKERGKRRK